MKRILLAGLTALLLAGCGGADEPQATPAAAPPAGSFRSHGCNGVTDEDVTKAADSTVFKKVLDSDAGCFWQEYTMFGAFGAGMGISTWCIAAATWTSNGNSNSRRAARSPNASPNSASSG